jgi:hypothetical protein
MYCAIRFIRVVQLTFATQFELAGDRISHRRGQEIHDHGHRHLGHHGQGEEVSGGPAASLV